MRGNNDFSSELDLTTDENVTDYSAEIQKQYDAKYRGKSLSYFENISGAVTAAKMHQYPMDPPELQTVKINAIQNLPEPKKAWLLYYQGAYLRKYGIKNPAMATAPSTIDLVNNKTEFVDLTEE